MQLVKMKLFILISLIGYIFSRHPQVDISSSSDWRIVGGTAAKKSQFKYQVSLRDVKNWHLCGGAILNTRWILTATHCVEKEIPSDVFAYVGTTSLSSGGDVYNISRFKIHPEFNDDKSINDIALIQTSTKIIFGYSVQPISVGKIRRNDTKNAVLSGWGRTSYQGPIPDKLQYLNVLTISNCECKKKHKRSLSEIYKSNLCTITKEGKGACHGDSGGPLVIRNPSDHDKLIGIVAWGRPCAKGYPDVYTRVSSYMEWIENILNE